MKKNVLLLVSLLTWIWGNITAQTSNPCIPKTLVVKAVPCNTLLRGEEVPALLDQYQIPFHTIEEDTWKKSHQNPKVQFRIAHNGQELLIHYKVQEYQVRAVTHQDNGRVWDDACVEFFVAPDSSATYYNFECNCIGKLLIQAGESLKQRQSADSLQLAKVTRWSSLGTIPFGLKEGKTNWELTLIIPQTVFFQHHLDSLYGKVMKGNFYKCGNKLPSPHFLSWSRIETPKPQFHVPEYFGTLYLE